MVTSVAGASVGRGSSNSIVGSVVSVLVLGAESSVVLLEVVGETGDASFTDVGDSNETKMGLHKPVVSTIKAVDG